MTQRLTWTNVAVAVTLGACARGEQTRRTNR